MRGAYPASSCCYYLPPLIDWMSWGALWWSKELVKGFTSWVVEERRKELEGKGPNIHFHVFHYPSRVWPMKLSGLRRSNEIPCRCHVKPEPLTIESQSWEQHQHCLVSMKFIACILVTAESFFPRIFDQCEDLTLIWIQWTNLSGMRCSDRLPLPLLLLKI